MINMILMEIDELLEYLRIGTNGLMVFLVFILLIVVGVSNLKKEIGLECKKGFSRFFVVVLVFLMFSTVFDFGFSLTNKILSNQVDWRDPYSISYFYNTIRMIWGITFGLGFLNKLIAFLLLFISIEIYLFKRKTKGKFIILGIVLLGGTFIITLVKIALYYSIGGIGSAITNLTVGVLTSLNYIILAIVIRILLKKTAKENESLKVYTKSISIGVLFLFNLHSIVQIFQDVRIFISYMFDSYDFYEYVDLLNLISYGLFFLSSLLFIIGIIVLSVGAIKTMSTPLNFSRKKGEKGIQRKSINTCSECGAPISPGVEFCTNCGKKN